MSQHNGSHPTESANRDPSSVAAYYLELLEPVYRNRDFVIIGGPVVGLAGLANSLKGLGASRLFLLGSSMGTGPPPDPETAEWYSFDHRSERVSDEFRLYESTLRDLPEAARTALDRFDPHKQAQAIGAILLSDVPDIDGRARYARRPSAWLALEDKIAIESFWETAKVAKAPSETIAIDADSLALARRRLDRGSGVVVAGDAREGIHGGAEFTRWIRSNDDVPETLSFFRAHCDRVRVMPFLEGVPCSIHGMVFPDHVAVFRPVEMIVLRRPETGAFVYAGIATFWDPSDADRRSLRTLARRVGEVLRDRVDYRGAFTIDGVLCADGFLPTEMNPRIGAGFAPLSMALPGLPLTALALAVAHGEKLDYRGEWLESAIVEASDRHRFGRGSLPLHLEIGETSSRRVVTEAEQIRLAGPDEAGNGDFVLGPGPLGCFFMFQSDSASLPPGTRFAPWAVRAFALADRELGTGIGAVEPAPDVRAELGGGDRVGDNPVDLNDS
ncbi:MAG: hypothetical protein VCE43_18925 [Myxococcota bacterium]